MDNASDVLIQWFNASLIKRHLYPDKAHQILVETDGTKERVRPSKTHWEGVDVGYEFGHAESAIVRK